MRRNFLAILLFTFLVVVTWVTSNILHTKSAVPITSELEQALLPINPNFDQSTLDLISKIQPPNNPPSSATIVTPNPILSPVIPTTLPNPITTPSASILPVVPTNPQS